MGAGSSASSSAKNKHKERILERFALYGKDINVVFTGAPCTSTLAVCERFSKLTGFAYVDRDTSSAEVSTLARSMELLRNNMFNDGKADMHFFTTLMDAEKRSLRHTSEISKQKKIKENLPLLQTPGEHVPGFHLGYKPGGPRFRVYHKTHVDDIEGNAAAAHKLGHIDASQMAVLETLGRKFWMELTTDCVPACTIWIYLKYPESIYQEVLLESAQENLKALRRSREKKAKHAKNKEAIHTTTPVSSIQSPTLKGHGTAISSGEDLKEERADDTDSHTNGSQPLSEDNSEQVMYTRDSMRLAAVTSNTRPKLPSTFLASDSVTQDTKSSPQQRYQSQQRSQKIVRNEPEIDSLIKISLEVRKKMDEMYIGGDMADKYFSLVIECERGPLCEKPWVDMICQQVLEAIEGLQNNGAWGTSYESLKGYVSSQQFQIQRIVTLTQKAAAHFTATVPSPIGTASSVTTATITTTTESRKTGTVEGKRKKGGGGEPKSEAILPSEAATVPASSRSSKKRTSSHSGRIQSGSGKGLSLDMAALEKQQEEAAETVRKRSISAGHLKETQSHEEKTAPSAAYPLSARRDGQLDEETTEPVIRAIVYPNGSGVAALVRRQSSSSSVSSAMTNVSAADLTSPREADIQADTPRTPRTQPLPAQTPHDKSKTHSE